MELERQNPEVLLKAIQRNEAMQKNGNLKIFFGYAAGVGKTYAMLQAAHIAKNNGIDVVVGYVEPHARPETAALVNGLEQLPTKEITQNEIHTQEFDLDLAIARHPSLIVIDELAHTNGTGCRHTKRYQDIEELLKQGIDVYTTINVQHIESLNDLVASITHIFVRERIPDSVFDNAHQVELVDIEPEDLLVRLKEGNIYKEDQAERAAQNFFTMENLAALRELALRRCADRVNILTENARIKSNGNYHTDEHILVCLSSAPSNEKIIRTAARMASAFRGKFTALFVETPSFSLMKVTDKKRLRENIHLAKQLGASIEAVYGEDVPFQIAEYARLSSVSKVVLGRSSVKRRRFYHKQTLTERLIDIAPNLDIHIIPDTAAKAVSQIESIRILPTISISIIDTAKSIFVLLMTTMIGLFFANLGFTEANIITVYILGVLIISIITQAKIYSVLASIVSVLVFNFFFTVPRFTLMAYDKGYPVTFAIMLIAALLTGSLAVKLKTQAKHAAQAAFRTKVLFDTNQLLQKARSDDEILTITAQQILKLLNRDIVVYPVIDHVLKEPHIFSLEKENGDLISTNEQAVAAWVAKNNKHAGATTTTLGSAKCFYLSVRINETVYGVIGIHIHDIPLESFENSVLLSILGECALALENSHNAHEKEQAAILAKNEQLRANLLRAISHDLRTPLTSISGNASNLLSNSSGFDEDTKRQIYTDIYDDTTWLINLVENLLSVTRIEENHINLRLSTELIDEVIAEALKHINRIRKTHTIRVNENEEFLLAKMDAKLIVQVIINIIDNALKYTPSGSCITIRSEKKNDFVYISIADTGKGISDELKPRVFDMFYSGTNRIADSRRSLGLGLSLCKSIITAHGGEINVYDNKPSGCIFCFTLPAGEVKLHE